jgi:peptidoglycan/LPS O-acetylase OafA/YrhL
MLRQQSVLGGLAILAVILNHTAGWGFTAMFWWTHRYREVAVPNYDAVGTLPYYALLIAKQLTLFAVPSFLLISGFFIAYAARGRQSSPGWNMISVRIKNLLVPYLIWSIVLFIGYFLIGTVWSPAEYLEMIVFGTATPEYFYVPAFCQLLLLAPLLLALAKAKPRAFVLAAILFHVGVLVCVYLHMMGATFPGLRQEIPAVPRWFFGKWLLFFALGIIVGLDVDRFKQRCARFKWHLLFAAVLLAVPAILEAEVIFRTIGEDWRGDPTLLSTTLYALAFAFCFLAFENITIPFSRFLAMVGAKSYGIYLLHPLFLLFFPKILYHVAPGILAHQIFYQPILFTAGLGGALAIMAVVAKSPVRRYYRYLFG